MSICSTVAKGCTIITITAAVLFGATAQAATKSTNMTVQLNVQTDCTIVANTLDFGNTSSALAANTDAQTTLTVNCSAGLPYVISMDTGLHHDGTTRRMAGATNATEYVNYEIYSDSGRASVWGTVAGTDTVDQNGTGADQNVDVFGRVPPQATPLADSYTDTVAVTITY